MLKVFGDSSWNIKTNRLCLNYLVKFFQGSVHFIRAMSCMLLMTTFCLNLLHEYQVLFPLEFIENKHEYEEERKNAEKSKPVLWHLVHLSHFDTFGIWINTFAFITAEFASWRDISANPISAIEKAISCWVISVV